MRRYPDCVGKSVTDLGAPGPANLGQGLHGRAYGNPEGRNSRGGRIFNLTGDTHPIHFHLVNVQVLSRQPFDVGYFMNNRGFSPVDILPINKVLDV